LSDDGTVLILSDYRPPDEKTTKGCLCLMVTSEHPDGVSKKARLYFRLRGTCQFRRLDAARNAGKVAKIRDERSLHA
jgi:hypothetical protein